MSSDLEAQLREVFREEAGEIIGELREVLQQLQNAGPSGAGDLIGLAMRLAHNLKGAAGNVGLGMVEEASHAMEDVMLSLRTRTEAKAPCIALTCDALSAIEKAIEGDEGPLVDVAARLTAFCQASLASTEKGPAPKPSPAAPAPTQRQGAPAGLSHPAWDSLPRPSLQSEGSLAPNLSRTVRISATRIDRLFGFVGELLVAETDMRRHQSALEAVRERLETAMSASSPDAYATLLAELDGLVQDHRRSSSSFQRLAGDLNDAMKRARMVPLASGNPWMRRTVDDAARMVNKPVDLELEVGQVELDKTVLDGLRDPLMHLLRNAVDHGIESAASRDLRGKPERALIRVSASLVGATVRIEVADDGRGIDLKGLTDVLVQRRLIAPSDASTLSDDALVDFLFRPGFSTRTETTRLSGRGVGLDVVRGALVTLGGNVRATCRGPLGGAAFVLTVPVSILSTRVLLVRAAGVIYAIPVHAIECVARLPRSSVRLLEGRPVVDVGKLETVRLEWLSRMFSGPSARDADQLRILVVSHGGRLLAVAVDEVLSEEEIVVRRLPWNIVSVAGVSGAATLADGSVAIAVDVAHLMSQPAAGARKTEGRTAGAAPIVLVVDDSMTTRTLHRNVLESAGYEVILANDGDEAWERLRHVSVDAVVSDVQMPGLNGFELTRRIRQDPRLSALTVVLVTSLSRPEDVQQGVEAGADAYVVKGPLERDALLEAVRRHLG